MCGCPESILRSRVMDSGLASFAREPGMTGDLRAPACSLHCREESSMTYVDAAVAPLRKNGQIKLHKADAFASMRKAGQLTARCLDMLAAEVKPGLPTERIDQLVFEFGMDHGAMPATLMYRGYRR